MPRLEERGSRSAILPAEKNSIHIYQFDHPSIPFVECAPCTTTNPCVKEPTPLHDCCDPPMGFRGHPHQG